MRLRSLMNPSAFAGLHRRRGPSVGRGAAAALAALALVFLAAPSASAHATVVSTSPDDNAVLATAPAAVSVTFDEAVSVSPDSLRVFAPSGVRVDAGTVEHPEGDVIGVRLRAGLADGTYVAAWHVVSADSHPVEGAFTFSVGAPSRSAVDVGSVNPAADRVVDAVYAAVRFAAFGGFAVLVGAVMFLALCWPSGSGRPGAPAVVRRGWALLVLGSLGALLLQGVYGSGGPLTRVVTRPQLLGDTLGSRFGVAVAVRIGLLLCLVPVRKRLGRLASAKAADRVRFAGAWGVFGLGLGVTWAVADHASVGIQVPLAVVSDSLHLLALACWIGGLVLLALLVLRTSQDPAVSRLSEGSENAADSAATAAARFSRVATWSVGFIALTGVYQAWRGVGSWGALTGTSYGRLVLLKVLGFGALLGLGYLSRRLVPRLGVDGSVRHLRRTVTTEACVATVVLIISALLVNTRTGRESAGGPSPAPATATVPFDTGGPNGRGILEAELAPGRPGRNEVRLDLFDPAGRALGAAQVTASLTLTARGIGPLAVPVAGDGPGSYAAAVDGVSAPGTWTLAVTIRSDDVDETTVRVPLRVR